MSRVGYLYQILYKHHQQNVFYFPMFTFIIYHFTGKSQDIFIYIVIKCSNNVNTKMLHCSGNLRYFIHQSEKFVVYICERPVPEIVCKLFSTSSAPQQGHTK